MRGPFRRGARGAGAALVVASLVATFAARGWEQTFSSGGRPLGWSTSCYYWSLNRAGSEDVPIETLETSLRAAYDAWEAPACSYFEFVETARAAVAEQAFHEDAGNANLVVFRDAPGSWPYSPAIVALTSVHYDPPTGEIRDADVEMNGELFTFAAQDSYPEGAASIDLQSTLTHEIGHTLGLDHSDVAGATMAPYGSPGQTIKRDLAEDDIDGLCAMYPIAQDPGVCREPHCGLDLEGTSTACHENAPAGEDCACTAPGARPDPGLFPLAAALAR